MEEQIGSKLEKEFVKAMYCYPAYLTYVEYCAMLSHSVVSDCDPMDCSPPGSSVLGDSSNKNTGVGCCDALLQGIFPTQGLNPGVLHSRRILYHQATREPWRRVRHAKCQAGIKISVMLNGLPWKQTEIILSFLRLHPVLHFRFFC